MDAVARSQMRLKMGKIIITAIPILLVERMEYASR
jgi:hypothetical protein